MAGFGSTLSQLIEDDRKYYRDAAAKRREYIQTYGTRAVVDREEKANAAMSTVNYLISNGIEEDDVRYVLDTSGVQGIAQLKATLDSRDDLTATEKANLVKKAKDYVAENPEEDLNSIVKRAYGLYQSSDNPVKRERSMFASMLGLDSRMMEDEVLDDMYINGYTGRDVYRIMGSSGPKPGGPLELDLPAKPPSPTILSNTAKFLESQFETSIDTRIRSVRQQMTKVDPQSTDYSDLVDEQNKLETLKGKGLLALGEYAAAYDPALFDFARAQEEALPGSITRNSYLFEFLPAFKTHFEEGADDRKLDVQTGAALGGGEAVGTPAAGGQPGKPTTVIHKAADESEAMELLQSGNVKVGDSIDINGTIRPVTKLPEGVVPKAAEPGTIDMTGAPGFRERDDIFLSEITKKATEARENKDGDIAAYKSVYDTIMSLPEDERNEYVEIFKEIEQDPDIMDVVEKAGGIASAAGNWLKEDADKSAGNIAGLALQGLAIASEGLNRVANFFNLTPEGQSARKVMDARELRDLGKRLYAEGIAEVYAGSESAKKRQEITDAIESSRTAERIANQIFKTEDARIEDLKRTRGTDRIPLGNPNLPITPREELTKDYSEAAKRAPDHVQKLGGQMARAWAKAQEEGGKAKDTFNKIFSRDALSPRGRNLYDDLAYFNEVGPVGVISDWLEANPDTPKEEVAKVLDVMINPRAVGTVGFQDLGLREDVRDIPEVVEELRKVGLVVPVPDDSMDAKARRGTGRTAMIEPVRPSQTPDPLKTARTLARLRKTNPEYFIDTSPAVVDGDTASQVAAQARTGSDRAPGLMSRMTPTRPSSADLEGAPRLGDPDFEDLIKRVHGTEKGESFQEKWSLGKIKAADVTRLIKSTQGLPKTKTRDKLLTSLYDLRDALNKR